MATRFDTVVKNARLARPNRDGLEALDIGIKDGKVAEVAPDLPASDGATVIDATGLIAFPGALDSHTHIGIYQHPTIDAPTETASAVSGGCTTMITYARTGSLYLNRPGPLQEFMPELLAAVEGRCYCDYGFHISPMSGDQVGQMEYLLIDI
ncbi:MAG: hydantoinase, partial [Dehalococcoidia bacterium]|nr:hydantoinase [Dehalococcoidia bacterium]